MILLVVKHDIRSPDVVTGHVELLHPAVLVRVPLQLVVPPELLHPQVGRHYLVLEVLKTKQESKLFQFTQLFIVITETFVKTIYYFLYFYSLLPIISHNWYYFSILITYSLLYFGLNINSITLSCNKQSL